MKKFVKLSVTLLVALTVATVTSTLSWLSTGSGVSFNPNFGNVRAAYFEDGDGTENDPYIISSPVHLYNLAWLQYLGYFNLNKDLNDGLSQTYFKLTENINMTGLALPPIGTTQYPFIGYFDGNGKTITSLTVSNRESDLKTRPSAAKFPDANDVTGDKILRTADGSGTVSVVGAFGVTGNYNDYITAYKAIDEFKSEEFSSQDMSVHSFYMDKLHVKSGAERTLVGLIAGEVCGNLKNVGVYRCDISLASGAYGLDGVPISKYSIVGDYDSEKVQWITSSSGQGWGGSVDMRTLNRRLNYIIAKTGSFSGWNVVTSDSKFNAYLSTGRTEFYWNTTSFPTGYVTVNLQDKTILPLNVNKSSMGIDSFTVGDGEESDVTISDGSRYTVNYKINSAYQSKSSEEVLSSNTGYIVGGGTNDIVTRIQPIGGLKSGGNISTTSNGLMLSLGQTEQNPALVYDDYKSMFRMYTIDVNGVEYEIKDWENQSNVGTGAVWYNSSGLDLQQYYSVRTEFDKTMSGANNNAVHGFHFAKAIPATISSGDGKTTTADVKINSSTTVKNYQLVKSGINFTLKYDGYITAIVGSYYMSSPNTLFDLFSVTRNSSGTITEFNQIKEIYKQNGKVVYKYTSGEDSSYGDRVFSFSNLNGSDGTAPLTNGKAYYFEIPVTAGDYVLGCATDSSSANGYLMYLDIGANGNLQPTHQMERVEFVDSRSWDSDAKILAYNADNKFSVVTFKLSTSDKLTADRQVVYKRYYASGTGTGTGDVGTDGYINSYVRYCFVISGTDLSIEAVGRTQNCNSSTSRFDPSDDSSDTSD